MRIWEQFPRVAMQVRQKHEEVGLIGHHDWVHAFRVGEVARQVALDEWEDDMGRQRFAHLAGLAGLCHNADRLLQKKLNLGRWDVRCERVEAFVASWLLGVDEWEVETIVEAVLGHDGRNSAEDSQTLIALMDADRVVNLDIDLLMRSGQFYHDLPAVDYEYLLEDPTATYRDPKSVLRDIASALDWVDPNSPVCVRTRLGKKMAEERAKILRPLFDALKMQLTEEGIHPYPFFS